MYIVNDHELKSVFALKSFDRYQYFINKAVDWGEIWSLKGASGWVMYGNRSGQECVPVWPAQRYAEICCVDEWSDCKPQRIGLEEWIDKWIPGMIFDSRMVAVFPLPSGRGIVNNPRKLDLDLREVLKNLM